MSALSEFVFQSKYAKFIPEKGRKETFEESVDRILQMHMTHLQNKYPQALENSDFCNDFIQASESCKKGLVYGSQRALQFGGDPILKHNEKLYNCSFTYADSLDVFKIVEWLGMNGCVEKHTNVLCRKKGIVPISQIKVGDEVLSFNLQTRQDEWKKVIKVSKADVKLTEQIVLEYSNGTILRTSKKHPILDIVNGTYEFHSYYDNENFNYNKTPNIGKQFNSNKSDIGWFLGAHVGDGNISIADENTYLKKKTYKIRITDDSEEVVDKYTRILNTIIDTNVSYKPSTNKNYKVPMWHTEVSNKNVQKLIDLVPDIYMENKTYNIDIPKYIKENDLYVEFLAGLLDTDGNYRSDRETLCWSTTSKNLTDSICTYLASIGCRFNLSTRTNVRENEQIYYVFSVSSSEQIFSEILKYSVKNTNREIECKGSTGVLLDSEYKQICDYLIENPNDSLVVSTKKRLKSKKTIRRDCLQHLTERGIFSTDQYNEIYSRVSCKSIKLDQDEKYDYIDITVEDNHNYYAGNFGLVNIHNCGVGASVERKHVDKIPPMAEVLNKNSYNHVISDDIEGWCYAVDALVKYFFDSSKEYPIFDFSQIRPKGAPISHGFLAPGPQPLKTALRNMEELLKKVHKRADKKLKPIEVTDLLAYEADSIISGGVRRSALSILFSPDDVEMYNSKIGNWWYDNPQRGRYNASAVLERQSTDRKTFDKLFESTKEFGEPGFVWRSNDLEGFNPCFEIGFLAKDKENNTGVQFCNLISISGKEITNEDFFYKACKDAATIGTIQASYMEFPFLGEVTENLVKADPLIGVSISGIMMNPEVLLNPDVLRKGAEIIKQQNAKIASILGINPSSRCTCIKPKN